MNDKASYYLQNLADIANHRPSWQSSAQSVFIHAEQDFEPHSGSLELDARDHVSSAIFLALKDEHTLMEITEKIQDFRLPFSPISVAVYDFSANQMLVANNKSDFVQDAGAMLCKNRQRRLYEMNKISPVDIPSQAITRLEEAFLLLVTNAKPHFSYYNG